MNTPSLPNLSSLNRQLAGDVNRVVKFIDTLPFHVDNLLAATKDQDWPEVARQSEYLAGAGEACNLQEISEAAKAVQTAINADNRLMACRAVLKLVSRCGSAKMPAKESKAKLS
jgi:hypothetical protein